MLFVGRKQRVRAPANRGRTLTKSYAVRPRGQHQALRSGVDNQMRKVNKKVLRPVLQDFVNKR